MAKRARTIIKEALKELEELDELVIDLAVVDEDTGLTTMLVMNTGDLLSRDKETQGA